MSSETETPQGDVEFRPRLREGVQIGPGNGPDSVSLFDARRLTQDVLVLSAEAAQIAKLCDGSKTVDEIAAAANAQSPEAQQKVGQLITTIDEALLFDSPKFQEYVDGPTRKPACIGVYPPDPEGIKETINKLFTSAGGPGLPSQTPVKDSAGQLRLALVPHIDYTRGGITYGWAFKELIEQTDARLFVIIGTAHYTAERFTLTRQNFETPLGTVSTDQDYINKLVEAYGDGLFNDRYAHLPEHSIELELLPLQVHLGEEKPFRIVPLLVGSFSDCVQSDSSPEQVEEISRMVEAMRKVQADTKEPICYIISGDLAHIGPKFGDPLPVDEMRALMSGMEDEKILGRLRAADPDGYFRLISAEKDARRVDGLPATWLALNVAKPASGRVLHYARYRHPEGVESVSFAAASFYE